MENQKVKWRGEELYLHFITFRGDYVLVSRTPEKTRMFKIDVNDLDEDGKRLCANLLVQVEKSMQ